jgi:hypothetical protein
MKSLVRVTASYKDENGKFKGSQEFSCRMDTDFLLYGEKEQLAKVFQTMIDSQMVGHGGTHTYVSCEPVFHEPIALEADFEELWEELIAGVEYWSEETNKGTKFSVEETDTASIVTIKG